MKNKILFLLVFAFSFLSGIELVSAQSSNYFPENCWGVYTWGGSLEDLTPETYPLVKGAPMVMKWNEIEPQPGKFMFDEVIRKKLEYAKKHNYYTFLKIWVAPNAPKWLYENGVPEVEMTKTINPLGKPRDWTFQHYLDPEYIVYFHRLISEFGKYVQTLPKDLQDRILYVQSCEGSTGDGGPYKGDPLDSKYKITNEQWGDFRMDTWGVFKKAFTNKSGGLVKPILVNQDSNGEKEYNWLLQNFPIIGVKHGMFSHGYDISDTKSRLDYWQKFKKTTAAKGIETFARGEQDGEWAVYGWHTKNTELAFYWSGIFASYCGIDMWNVPSKASVGIKHKEGMNFFNKYAGKHNPSTSKVAFCALRKGLNAADSISYPESKYGKCVRNNIDRYNKIAESFSQFGAYQGDPGKAIGGGMANRQSKDYNDVGWNITEGNYNRFIDQINADETSEGWWHVGPQESIYGRFARSIKIKDGKGGMYFDVNDDFSKNTKKVELRIVWLDKGLGEWTVSYNAEKKADKNLFAIKNGNTGKWMEKTVLISDAQFTNKGARKSDIAITAKGSETTVFHILDITKK